MKRFKTGLTTACLLVMGTAAAFADAPLDGFGHDVPLSFAVRQIVPMDHGVFFGDGVDTDREVSWEGGRGWREVLKDTLGEAGLSAEVVDDRVMVTKRAAGHLKGGEQIAAPGLVVVPYAEPEEPTFEEFTQDFEPEAVTGSDDESHSEEELLFEQVGEEPAATDGEGDDVAGDNAAADEPPPSVIQDETAIPEAPEADQAEAKESRMIDLGGEPDIRVSSGSEWKVPEGSTLREVLADWAEVAGWSLVWNSPYEYPMQAGAVFYGEFVESDPYGQGPSGAAVDLVHSMKTARPAVNADFYMSNKVLVVTTSADEQN